MIINDHYLRHYAARQSNSEPQKWIATLLFTFTLLLAPCAVAQDSDPTYEQRLELARQMHEIWPIRLKTEKALDEVAIAMPPEERAAFKAAMRRAIKFTQLEEESINSMVKIFTAEELESMVEFYGSPTGRSVTAKIEEYQKEISPVYTEMMDRALMDIRTGSAPGQIR